MVSFHSEICVHDAPSAPELWPPNGAHTSSCVAAARKPDDQRINAKKAGPDGTAMNQ